MKGLVSIHEVESGRERHLTPISSLYTHTDRSPFTYTCPHPYQHTYTHIHNLKKSIILLRWKLIRLGLQRPNKHNSINNIFRKKQLVTSNCKPIEWKSVGDKGAGLPQRPTRTPTGYVHCNVMLCWENAPGWCFLLQHPLRAHSLSLALSGQSSLMLTLKERFTHDIHSDSNHSLPGLCTCLLYVSQGNTEPHS